MGPGLQPPTSNLLNLTMKVLCLPVLVLACALISVSVDAAPQPVLAAAGDRGFGFLLALGRLRCRSTCAAASYASTTTCTRFGQAISCNPLFPVSAAAAS